ncbi:DUF262 domain-containing HNH endonuclease family protein [Halorhodospira halochloris]|uniref:DUF262 domain-containing protein n=1 Tax=Halorhodospira halochloris TaxID=1052 RepID=UPI001EE82E7F|nr:DUF262 domain-containing protein [Halorhodospira halochloris]MCG5531608.1 DUF262 domain-containing HNH endonuclease family protein [Halorhodospira halochloris]
MSTTFDAPTVGIGRLIGDGSQFSVPHHQRDYSWGEDEIEQLFTDIEEAQATGQEEYFVGLMVFLPYEDKSFTILDGQQRLATAAIILSAIRSWLRVRDFREDAQQIESEFIAVRELGTSDYRSRLELNENNHPYFEQHVVRESPNEDVHKDLRGLNKHHPSRALLEAIIYCRERVGEIANNAGENTQDGAERLYSLVAFLKEKVKVVRLTVPTEANAYTVFETLNDRGLDLTVLDLVKNHVFGRAGRDDRLREVKSLWTQMTSNLTNVRADDFLKTWWTSRYGRTQKTQLFPSFKKKISAWSDVQNASQDMLRASEQYAALELADDPVWQDYSEQVRESISTLKLLGAKQVHPIILSAVDKFNSRELERLLWLLEVLIVRYQLIGGGRTGRLEMSCAALAVKVWNGDVTSAKAASDELSDIMPNDNEFQEAFRYKEERNSRKASFVLSKLEKQARSTRKDDVAGGELKPSGSITLEHILPKNPGADWSSETESDPDLVEDNLYRYGNLCLLSNVNRKIGNKGFQEKKATFARSEILLTNMVSEYNQWTRQEIDLRQAHLAKLARTVWSFQ